MWSTSLIAVGSLAPVVGVVFGLVVVWKLAKFILKTYRSPLRDLPGPPSPSWLFGQFRVLFNSPVAEPQEEWIAKYGKNIRYTEILSVGPIEMSLMDADSDDWGMNRATDS